MECNKCGKEICVDAESLQLANFCYFCGTKVLPKKMIVKGCLHGDKEDDYYQAQKIGLSEVATKGFIGWGYVEFDLEVDTETGKTEIIAVNGHKLVK